MMQGFRALTWRRSLFVWPIAALALALAVLAWIVVGPPRTLLDGAIFALFVTVMSWQSFIAWQYVLGFVAWVVGRNALSQLERRASALSPVATGRSRTAVLLPIYNEDPAKVFAAVEVMARSVGRTGATGDLEFHVLSDTRDAQIADQEERAYEACLRWREAASATGEVPVIRYRRRSSNEGRKVGNIAEFLERWGAAFDHMIVLDADSLMSGATMRKLIRLMEESPTVGLIQTVSYATNRETLFARVQQFAVRLYAPLAIRGLDIWQDRDGSYWGHNAILRVKAFAQHCELPVLSGHPPFGGEILCHDTVEAALMRRAGWEVRLLPEIEGTWEEMPTNTVDLLARERRWCQGNLQHLRVLTMPGLRSASRAHLALGVAGYVAAPLWAFFLLLGTLRALVTQPPGQDLGLLAYGLTSPSPAALALFALVVTVLGAPKVLSLVHVLADGRSRRAFGGTRNILVSAALEQAIWTLLWPVLTVFNAASVITTVLGHVVRWDPQSRDDRPVPAMEAVRRHAPHIGYGVILTAALAWAGGAWLALWMAPIALALVLSPALTALTSRIDLGRLSQRHGLFLTVDDTAPAEELRELRAALGSLAPASAPPVAVGVDELAARQTTAA